MFLANNLADIVWVLLCTAMVLMMQAGFCCLESGLVRSKNSINVAVKNFADLCVSTSIFWMFGFAIMFGVHIDGRPGTTSLFFNETGNAGLTTFFLFQLVFCGTATTIISGAVSERMKFAGYLIVAAMVSGVIYPLFGHWAWGGLANGSAHGWLRAAGFIDFAGSTVVHSIGGWAALAAVIVIGPRIGRFDPTKPPIRGHNLPMATLGVFLLWFGWFGFNGGSHPGGHRKDSTYIRQYFSGGCVWRYRDTRDRLENFWPDRRWRHHERQLGRTCRHYRLG